MIRVKDIKEKYSAYTFNKGKSYHLYDKDNIGIYSASPFISEIFKHKRGWYYVEGFNPTNNFETLINNIETKISLLPYPSEFYNPLYKEGHNLEIMVDYDMRNLGFEKSLTVDGNLYKLKDKNIYGQERKNVNISFKNLSSFGDLTKGVTVMYFTSNYSVIATRPIERDAKKIINEVKKIINPLSTSEAFFNYEMSNKTDISDLDNLELIEANIKNGQIFEKDFKSTLKTRLENILNKL